MLGDPTTYPDPPPGPWVGFTSLETKLVDAYNSKTYPYVANLMQPGEKYKTLIWRDSSNAVTRLTVTDGAENPSGNPGCVTLPLRLPALWLTAMHHRAAQMCNEVGTGANFKEVSEFHGLRGKKMLLKEDMNERGFVTFQGMGLLGMVTGLPPSSPPPSAARTLQRRRWPLRTA